jgi:hypothetical protein
MHGITLFYIFLAAIGGGLLWSLLNMFKAMVAGEGFSLPKFGLSFIYSIGSAGGAIAAAAALPAETDAWLVTLLSLTTGAGGTALAQGLVSAATAKKLPTG